MNVYEIHHDNSDYVTILSAENSERAIELYCELSNSYPFDVYAIYIPEVHADRELVIYSNLLDDEE